VQREPADPSGCAAGICPDGLRRSAGSPSHPWAIRSRLRRAAHRGRVQVPWACSWISSQNLLGERDVGLRAFRAFVPYDSGGPVAGSFGKPHVARHHRAVDLVAEVLLQLLGNLVRERISRIKHGAQEACDFEARVEIRTYPLDGPDKVG